MRYVCGTVTGRDVDSSPTRLAAVIKSMERRFNRHVIVHVGRENYVDIETFGRFTLPLKIVDFIHNGLPDLQKQIKWKLPIVRDRV